MKHQLIVTILGADRIGILSTIANTVSETCCNILDSRQAIYGQDFSLTMILEGTQTAITKAELKIPQICQQHDLLSMMKRTKQHSKQNLARLVDIQVQGEDTVGVIKKITGFLDDSHIAVNAFRQKTFTNQDSQKEMMQCKMVASVAEDFNIDEINLAFTDLLSGLGLSGTIEEKH